MKEGAVMTKAEAVEYMRLSVATIDRLMKNRALPYVKVGKKVLFRRPDIDVFLEKRLVK
jgi:excisionase family DNA binding protein